MKALDTKVLARFFVDDPDDAQAAEQRPAAIEALSQRAFVSVTVLLELEWVLRGSMACHRKRFPGCYVHWPAWSTSPSKTETRF